MTQNIESQKVTRFGTCSKDCYGSCVFKGYWDDHAGEKKLLTIYPEVNHPFTKGFFCPKLKDRKRLLYHPERLKSALIRKKEKGTNEFQAISIESAIELIVKKIKEIETICSPEAIIGAFNAGNYGLLSRFAPLRFFKKLGATITTGGICNEGGCSGLDQLFGTYSITNPLQLIHPATELIVIWGSNVSDRNNHAYFLIKQAKKNGAKLIVIDSRYTPIAKIADLFIPTIPGTDHLVALIVCKYIIEKGLHDNEFLESCTEGYRLIIKDVTQFNEKEIIGKLGWRSDQIYHFVDLLKLHQKHTIFNIGFGVQKDFYGGKIVQLIALIQILLGNIGNPGTGIIYSQSDFCKKTLKPLVEYITNIRSTDSLPEVSLINLSKALRSDKYKMVFIYNFNPLSSLPNHNMVRRSFLRKDLFVVVQDVFLNETSKYADIVIPSKFDLETHDIISPYYLPSISINEAGPCPYPDCLSNFEFYKKLSNKMNWGNESLFIEDDKSIVDNCLKLLPLDYKRNILIKGYHALFEVSDTPFNDLLFPTKSRKINLSELNIDFGFQRLKMVEDRKKNEFFLITPSHKYYIHSQLGRINKGILSDFKNVYISKEDMKTHDLKEGMMVLVQNEYGKGKFILAKSSFLVKGIAMIYSGSPMANFFTPDIPEELGESGAYNSAIIEIRVLKRN